MTYADISDVRRHLEREDWSTTGLSNPELESRLDDANMVVEEDIEPAADDDDDLTLSDRRLAKIESALAAHYVLDSGIDDLRQVTGRGSADGARAEYGSPRIASTTMGDRAIEFDPTGVLARKLSTESRSRVIRDTDRHSDTVSSPGSTED